MATTQSPSEKRMPPIPGPSDQLCPHKHFKIEIIDRTKLSRKQHLNLLCTPKGYVWVIKKPISHQDDASAEKEQKNWLRKLKCMGIKRKSKRASFYNILAEVWKLLTPEMVNRLKEMLVQQFGMTEEQALRYICEQRAMALARSAHHRPREEPDTINEEIDTNVDERVPRIFIDKKPCDPNDFAIKINPNHVKELSKVIATKLTKYVIFMMNAKRDKRQKKIAKSILQDLCNMTGEHCTLSDPKNRLQKILTFGADRMALWLAQNLKRDKPDERKIREEDDEMKKRHEKKLKEKEWRDEEFKRLAKGAERRRQKEEKDREEAEKKMNEEKEKKKKADEERRNQLRPSSKEKGAGDKPDEKGKQKPKGPRRAERLKEKKNDGKKGSGQNDEEKKASSEKTVPNNKPLEDETKTKNEAEPESEGEGETEQAGIEETGGVTEDRAPQPQGDVGESAEETAEESSPDEAQSGEENEAETRLQSPEVPPSSEENKETDEDSGIGKTPQTGETQKTEEVTENEGGEEEGESVPDKRTGSPTGKAIEVEKSPSEKVLEKAASIIADTKPVETPRQEALKDVISKELEKRITPTDDETVDQIRSMSSKVATWVDKSLKDVEEEYGERPKLLSPVAQRPKGPLFSVRKADDHYQIRRATNAEAEKKVRSARGKAPDKGPLSPNNAKAWTQWALDASKMAENWGRWIDKTVQEAQEKSLKYKYSGKEKGKRIDVDGEDWNSFKDKTTKEAAMWRQNKKILEEVAQLWKQRMESPAKNN